MPTEIEDDTSNDGENRSSAPAVALTITPTRTYIIVFGYDAYPLCHLIRIFNSFFRLWISLFISAMDTTIISTALFSISSEFRSFNQSGWLIVSYLLTYNGI